MHMGGQAADDDRGSVVHQHVVVYDGIIMKCLPRSIGPSGSCRPDRCQMQNVSARTGSTLAGSPQLGGQQGAQLEPGDDGGRDAKVAAFLFAEQLPGDKVGGTPGCTAATRDHDNTQ